MTVKHEIKSQLAKLLATEDLIVENKKVETAAFNVHTRVLTLPQWDRASNNVYDMLVSHEVGHALYTPDRDWFTEPEWIGLNQSFVNIVEDVRIEKLMKRRYAGISKTFYNGYHELSDEDFFDVEGVDVDKMNLADKVNLYFKIGNFLDIKFTVEEMVHVTNIDHCETFDDVLVASKSLFEYCQQELEKKQKEEMEANLESITGDGEGEGEGGEKVSGNSGTIEDELEDSEEPKEDESFGGTAQQGGKTGGTIGADLGSDELEVETADSLADALKGLTNMGAEESSYFELPKLDLDNVIVSNKEIHDNMKTYWAEEFETIKTRYDMVETPTYLESFKNRFVAVDAEFIKFKRSAQKEVNYLVKEFECKKSADSYARATTARTGVLDCTKLHTYKYNEDLFKKVTTLADGKNHGLVFILDWSGSMQHVLHDTVKQLYNLLWFCKKVSIPFEVYAFTNEYPRGNVDEAYNMVQAYEKKAGLAIIETTFSLMNLFTSKVKGKELEEHMKHIFRLSARCYSREYGLYGFPLGMNLSGTPLNETLVALHQILPKFQKENNLQKVQCVVLTDGEAAPLRFSKEFDRQWEDEPFLGSAYIGNNCYLRNRKTGHTYSCQDLGHWADVTGLLLTDLRQTFPNTNFIGIRVMESRAAGQFVRRYTGYEDDRYEKTMSAWKKDRAFSIKDAGYHTYFGLCSSALSNDDEFEVQQDATKAQIKRAFVKSLKTKKMNKKILGEFVELVA